MVTLPLWGGSRGFDSYLPAPPNRRAMYELKEQKIKSNDCNVEYWLDGLEDFKAVFHLSTGQTLKIHIEPENDGKFPIEIPLVITELRDSHP